MLAMQLCINFSRFMRLLFTSLLLVLFFPVAAITIQGEVFDAGTRAPMADVSIVNVHTDDGTLTDEQGRFTIAVAKGQLLELRKIGYKTLRVRIPDGSIPSYFKLEMHPGPIELPEFDLQARNKDWKRDSARYYELYKGAIEFEKLDGLDVIRHPFSALSKRNRQIWAFQKEYNYWEQQKFIDYTFNDKLINSITGLSGDSLNVYMTRFRPTYDFLRSVNEYTYYGYIKESVEFFRTGRRKYVPSIRRSAN